MQVQIHLHSKGIWLCYFVGQLLHIAFVANAAIQSKINAVNTWPAYFKVRWIPLVSRGFLSVMAFLLVWDNPRVIDMDNYIDTAKTAIAMAGILGYFSDSVLDKVLNVFSKFLPGLQKELPAAEASKP